ncbi:hypothetical protein LMH87_002218 [Akanthomyces muscarius]|uniref:Pre-mRNA-splicing factor 38B n=1 Tax=Akanthomyces muscarius TaxID=2231603 RepID=A0A9W8Q7W5_AKAMU|nr:hypothetical protein LMH87_002218 [Akanthomyces muscarius]KAJ4147710.1 hypothetical protein LMH87_002218 [Akanthomyces muscarius]
MSNEEILTDDYVAGLLSQEASDCSIKYSALGVDAFLGKDSSSKKPANIPKPNTRFLRNIIKGTDTHNKALLAKEAAESKARLKRLERTEDIKRKKSNPSTKDIRERHMGDIQAILGGGKSRKRVDDNSTNKTELDGRDQDNAKRKSRAQKDRDYEKEGRRRNQSSSNHPSDSHEHHSGRRHDRHNSRHMDHSSEDEHKARRHKSSRDDRSKSPRSGHRSNGTRSRDSERRRYRHRSPSRNKSPGSHGIELALQNSQHDEIGPAPPPPIIRGRGAVGASSGIDRRFSASYDPKVDIQGADNADA